MENDWIEREFGCLVGARVEALAVSGPESEKTMGLLLKLRDGRKLVAWVLQDEEGNGAERARLATVLDQITDGVLIADSQGIIQFANPAAGRLFQAASLIEKSIVEVVRNYQLVEAWRRCQQTRQMQSESVELPTRHQYLQLVGIPDQHSSGAFCSCRTSPASVVSKRCDVISSATSRTNSARRLPPSKP